MIYHINITGNDEIYSIVLKNVSFEVAKEKAISIAKQMIKPKTLSIYDGTGVDRSLVYEYVKRS